MKKISRRKTRCVRIGNVKIGCGQPIAIQSMLKAKARDLKAAVPQIIKLADIGCDIVRLAVENQSDALAIAHIKRQVKVPIVADIHFDYRLALTAIDAGVDKVRLNPGNIYKTQEIKEVIAAAKNAHIPIRVGANSGSLRIKARDMTSALVKSVLDYLKLFEKQGFYDIVISLKGSDILNTVAAYSKLAGVCDYPLHVGVTATGLPLDGVIKSSIGIGVLLFQGIGDTIRVSLLGDPAQEVLAAQVMLNSLGLRSFGPEWICCPTCGRCEVDLPKKAAGFEGLLKDLSLQERYHLRNYKIALMGCVVNGPGEAKEATLGIAFSKHKAILFKKGKIIGTVPLDEAEKKLFVMLKKDIAGRKI
ncbi:MAG: flavodoxin-dependent (E)-4-hydroxy-3-methylbut-2-enyl-diphosphate synthase [Candidatus Omnitrophota bacterium]